MTETTTSRTCCPTKAGEHHQCERRASRGTTNKNVTGNSEDRRRRRQWLVEAWPADVVRLVATQVSPFAGSELKRSLFTELVLDTSVAFAYRIDVGATFTPLGMDRTFPLWTPWTLEAAPGSVASTLASWRDGTHLGHRLVGAAFAVPVCRCYRCGTTLDATEVSPDRIKPGAEGGTYARTNIRPACQPCQSTTGGSLGAARKAAKPNRRRTK